ncbi:hypothetical protein KQX54_017527 [Cotesia glomerata]|uniref:CUB domain-containing protein n=1 Tax=Cotesia glomerata TaxID=32391 RepID=A0AAV7HWU6_COTGL|nr:hypothetical protein KQX54_017527 [Cotesia glomerata]
MLAPHGHRIKFAITSLDIYETADCATDYLEIADGKFCRTGNEASLHSTDNRMLVKYRKSGESTHKGFTAQYQQTCNHTIFVDGKIVHLESPNYPEPYGANQQCYWWLFAPENHQLTVKLDFVELENKEDNCSLKFDDGRTETSACAFDKAAEYFSTDNYLNSGSITCRRRSLPYNDYDNNYNYNCGENRSLIGRAPSSNQLKGQRPTKE